MIKLKDLLLTETPVKDYQFFDNNPETGSFTDNEKRNVTDSAKVIKIKNFFSKTPAKFNLYFINFDSSFIKSYFRYEKSYGMISYRNLQDKLHINSIPEPRSDEITIIFTGNYGDSLMPLTPWIIAHRISHVLAGSGYEHDAITHEIQKLFRDIIYEIDLQLSSIFQFFYKTDPINFNWIFSNENGNRPTDRLYTKIFTFKSARTDNFTASGEFIHELFAQYIRTGTVELIIPDEFTVQNIPFKVEPQYKNSIENQRIKLIERINKKYAEVLNKASGNVYII